MRSCGQEVAAVISNLVSTRNNFRTSVAIRYFTQQGEGTSSIPQLLLAVPPAAMNSAYVG
ncbi:MAG: hypothetical protein H6545_03050 [Bacteroidales bacterium]|nr:hypothetical protein [Bacteroidales bacterium]